MTAGLETFAKIRTLHDRATIPGEKAAAMTRMQTLARKAGMSVEQAVSKLDAPKPAAPRNLFEELFNTPEFRVQQAERQDRKAKRRAAALSEYGSEDAIWEPSERERALEAACRPLIVRKPITGGEIDTLQGWDGGGIDRVPPDVQQAAINAYAPPKTVREAWAEFNFWEKLYDDRDAFGDHDHFVWVRARFAYLDHLMDVMPAKSMNDLRVRLGWMQHLNERGFSRDVGEDAVLLNTLRADIERMGERIREQDGEPVQSGHHEGGVSSTHPSPEPVQSGHPRRTNADKRRDVIALLEVGKSDNARLTDREIARRAGVSPTTVGTIRRALA